MVSEKKIKMLKATFVATQIEVLQVVPQLTFCALPTYITNMSITLGLYGVHYAGSHALYI